MRGERGLRAHCNRFRFEGGQPRIDYCSPLRKPSAISFAMPTFGSCGVVRETAAYWCSTIARKPMHAGGAGWRFAETGQKLPRTEQEWPVPRTDCARLD